MWWDTKIREISPNPIKKVFLDELDPKIRSALLILLHDEGNVNYVISVHEGQESRS